MKEYPEGNTGSSFITNPKSAQNLVRSHVQYLKWPTPFHWLKMPWTVRSITTLSTWKKTLTLRGCQSRIHSNFRDVHISDKSGFSSVTILIVLFYCCSRFRSLETSIIAHPVSLKIRVKQHIIAIKINVKILKILNHVQFKKVHYLPRQELKFPILCGL